MASEANGMAARHRIILVLACALALAACQSGGNAAANKPALRQPQKGLVTATLASAADRSGDLISAQGFYGQLIAEGHATGQTYERRGEILLTLGQPQQATLVFEAAIQAGFDSPVIRRGYARGLALLARPEAALAQYDAVLAKNPVDVKAMNGRGVALDMLGRHDAAQGQYKLAMTQAPGDLAVQNNLAMSYALSGKAVEAVAILERINASGAATVQHRQNLALLYGLLGRTEKAQALASQDLPAEDVARNMATYATMQVLYDGQPAAAVPAVVPPAAVPSTPAPPVAPPASTPPASVPAAPPPMASMPEASASAAAVPEPEQPAAPAAAAPVSVPATEAATAQPQAAAPAAQVRQPWVVDLGVFDSDVAARDVWQKIKQQPQFGQTVHYLEPEGSARRLLAGPFWGDEAARNACAAVRGQGLKCDPRQASAVRSGAASQPPASQPAATASGINQQ